MNALKKGDPCEHAGCFNHVTHPCEGCGRYAAGLLKAPLLTMQRLKTIVDQHLKDFPNDGNQLVKIILSSPSMPARATVEVISAGMGFDWENGLLLEPEKPIIKKPKKRKKND